MVARISQKNWLGSFAIGSMHSSTPPRMCSAPYSFSALIQRSATMPISEGMNRAEMPMVEKIAPKLVPDQPRFSNQ